jgi:hypothetical protein
VTRFRSIAAAFALLSLAGCSSIRQRQVYMEPASTQTLEYYPFQVKGYQNTYPKKRLVVVPVFDQRDFKDAAGVGHEPYKSQPAIGVILDQSGKIDQRLYGPALEPLVQNAVARAAQETGMFSSTTVLTLKQTLAARNSDYVLMATITRCWVNKHRGPDNQSGVTWLAAADVALQVAIYKPPFGVPFWQGESVSNYSDPPAPAAGASPEDETEIYDQPGQVLSVALTRAVAGIFKRDDLHTLILQDSHLVH